MYPADTLTWFDPSKDSQVVLFAHMLFPLRPGQDDLNPAPETGPWHPPLIYHPQAPLSIAIDDNHVVMSQWIDPDGQMVAAYSLTMPARVSADYLRLQNRLYIPHTFAMSIGTKDIRTAAGQTALPSKAGQYHIRFYVDGDLEGIAFFRILGGAGGPAQPVSPSADALSPSAEEAPLNALRDVFQALTKTGQ